MILEIAQIDVKPGMEAEFEAGVKKAAPIFKRAKGCKFMTLQRSHEVPQRYRCNGKRWKPYQGFPGVSRFSRVA
jgi:heme-degrading monooxygenase HmoA